MKKEATNYYDVFYKTKSGRGMIAKRIEAKTDKEAKEKVKKQMHASTTFSNVISVIKL